MQKHAKMQHSQVVWLTAKVPEDKEGNWQPVPGVIRLASPQKLFRPAGAKHSVCELVDRPCLLQKLPGYGVHEACHGKAVRL